MKGHLFSTGITVGGCHDTGWWAQVTFLDDGLHTDVNSVQGILVTKNAQPSLETAIATIKQAAEAMGVIFQTIPGVQPCLYYEQDGMSQTAPPPKGWRTLLAEQATRIGWVSYLTRQYSFVMEALS